MTERTAEEKEVLATLGACLREMRQDLRLHQKVVAEAAGITRPMLSAYERGRVMVTLPVLLRLLDAMGASLVTLHGYRKRRAAMEVEVEQCEAMVEAEIVLDELTRTFGIWLRSVAANSSGGEGRDLEAAIRRGFRRLEGEMEGFFAGTPGETRDAAESSEPGEKDGTQ